MTQKHALSSIVPLCLVFASVLICTTHARAEDDAQQLAEKIDAIVRKHWQTINVRPAGVADDATFRCRITLDLAGRIPTPEEVDAFLKDASKGKREKLIRDLMNGPEFPLHFSNVLDQMIQGRHAGDDAFVEYLRASLRDGKSWSAMFREMMLGPWDKKEIKAANRFLDKRARNTEELTAETARAFFGVDVSCAKCHDHPLVDDWKQDHFYGMMAFFNRTTGGRGKVGEKNSGEVKFLKDGKEKTAKMMFLSGRIIDEPAKDKKGFSRREQLVRVALEEKTFLSRALVNRAWEYFFGRGLVSPTDQMHSGSRSAVPGLLELMSDDFAAHDYDLRRLITAIVSTRAYQLSSRWKHGTEAPGEKTFAAARLRPLTRQQFAFSLLVATGNGVLSESGPKRIEQYLAIEKRAKELTSALDPRTPEHQSSAAEALFLSNNEASQKLLRASEDNLTARLSRLKDTKDVVTTAMRAVLSRSPSDDELGRLVEWFNAREQPRGKTCEQLVWALVTSAEFRFNH